MGVDGDFGGRFVGDARRLPLPAELPRAAGEAAGEEARFVGVTCLGAGEAARDDLEGVGCLPVPPPLLRVRVVVEAEAGRDEPTRSRPGLSTRLYGEGGRR